jgi:hypothetical protein
MWIDHGPPQNFLKVGSPFLIAHRQSISNRQCLTAMQQIDWSQGMPYTSDVVTNLHEYAEVETKLGIRFDYTGLIGCQYGTGSTGQREELT